MFTTDAESDSAVLRFKKDWDQWTAPVDYDVYVDDWSIELVSTDSLDFGEVDQADPAALYTLITDLRAEGYQEKIIHPKAGMRLQKH